MSTHTPGPWRAVFEEDGDADILPESLIDGEQASITTLIAYPYDKRETFANANLIAAAPELLAIAEDLLELAIEERYCFYQSVVSPDGSIDPEEAETLRIEGERIANAKAVIARAKGESQ